MSGFLQSIGSFFGFGGKAVVAPKADWTVSGSEDQGKEYCDDMVFEIFSHLGKQDLVRGMRVCQRWNVILQKNNLWREIFSQRNEIMPNRVPDTYFYLYESFH